MLNILKKHFYLKILLICVGIRIYLTCANFIPVPVVEEIQLGGQAFVMSDFLKLPRKEFLFSNLLSAMFFKMLGEDLFTLRIGNMLLGIATIFFYAFVLKALKINKFIAFIFLFFISTNPFVVISSSLGDESVTVVSLGALLFLTLLMLSKTLQLRYYLLLGILSGISYYEYISIKPIIFLSIMLSIYISIKNGIREKRFFKYIFLMIALFCLISFPYWFDLRACWDGIYRHFGSRSTTFNAINGGEHIKDFFSNFLFLKEKIWLGVEFFGLEIPTIVAYSFVGTCTLLLIFSFFCKDIVLSIIPIYSLATLLLISFSAYNFDVKRGIPAYVIFMISSSFILDSIIKKLGTYSNLPTRIFKNLIFYFVLLSILIVSLYGISFRMKENTGYDNIGFSACYFLREFSGDAKDKTNLVFHEIDRAPCSHIDYRWLSHINFEPLDPKIKFSRELNLKDIKKDETHVIFSGIDLKKSREKELDYLKNILKCKIKEKYSLLGALVAFSFNSNDCENLK